MRNNSYILICLFSSALWAEEQNVAYLDMSLEELLKIKITAPSRRGENQLLAPGVVSVITAQEIRQFGAKSLGDVLERAVNMQIIGAHTFPNGKMSLRALNATQSDNSVLLLLNGRPIREAVAGGNNANIYAGFPLQTIHRIEIIRGPGSVLYGTNAFAGVINIVTYNQEEVTEQTQVNVSIGSYDRQQVQLTTNLQTDDYKLTVGLNFSKSAGDDFDGTVDRDGHVGVYETGEEITNLVASGSYKGFSFDALLTDSTTDTLPVFFQLPSKPLDFKTSFFDVGYQHKLTDTWHSSVHYTFGQDKEDWTIDGDNDITRSAGGRAHLLEITAQGQFRENFDILLGASYSAFSRYLEKNIWRKSVFAQADYLFTEKQKIISGFQWNKPEESAGDFSPRIGFIQGFGEHWWLKLLYSEAFRSPFIVELFADAPALLGNPKLEPEKVSTTDVQLIYQTTTQYYALSLYYSKVTDIIGRELLPGMTRNFMVNKGEIDFYGVEFEGKQAFGENITFIGNANYQYNENDTGIKDTMSSPNVMVKLGFTYTGKPGVTLGVFNSYFGDATDLRELSEKLTPNPKPTAYNLLTANLLLDTGKLWGWGQADHSFVSLYLDNLLDETIYTPDLNHQGINSGIPHHWGFGAYLNYQYRF